MSRLKNRYCCKWFEILHIQPYTSDCIRVIYFPRFPIDLLYVEYTFDNQNLTKPIKNSNVPYRFFRMSPVAPNQLSEKFKIGIKGDMLSFCPCCGVNLYSFYVIERNINDYVNEIEGETF